MNHIMEAEFRAAVENGQTEFYFWTVFYDTNNDGKSIRVIKYLKTEDEAAEYARNCKVDAKGLCWGITGVEVPKTE
jgi:hypothetical protein